VGATGTQLVRKPEGDFYYRDQIRQTKSGKELTCATKPIQNKAIIKRDKEALQRWKVSAGSSPESHRHVQGTVAEEKGETMSGMTKSHSWITEYAASKTPMSGEIGGATKKPERERGQKA